MSDYKHRREVVEFIGMRLTQFQSQVAAARAALGSGIAPTEYGDEVYRHLIDATDRFPTLAFTLTPPPVAEDSRGPSVT